MKKVMVSVLSLVMLLTVLPLGAVTVAAEDVEFTATIQNGGAILNGYFGKGGDIIIPDTIRDYPVVAIQNNTFWNNPNITSVVLPEGLTTIGSAAFSWCQNLVSVTCPSTLTTIGDGAFKYCSSLAEINFPFNLETIGYEAFISCTSLTSILLPGNVTEVGPSAFAGCSNVSVIKLSGSMDEIRPAAFSGCAKVKELVIPEGIVNIHNFAFSDCLELTTVTIPRSVKEIHDNIVDYCSKLTTVYYGGTREEMGNIWMSDLNDELLNARWHCTDDPPAAPVTIVTQPKTATYAKDGQEAVVTVKAEGDGLTYAWYRKLANADYYIETSVVSPTYAEIMGTGNHNCRLYCVITDSAGNSVRTDTVLLRRQATITKESATASYAKMGGTVSASVTAVGDGLTYAWYYKNEGKTTYSKSSVTKSTYSATMSDKVKNRRVYCIVKDKFGKTVQSKTFLLREAASIVTQPKTGYAKLNAKASVTVKASGDGLTYTWYIKNAGKTSYSKSSVTSATYSTTLTSSSKNRMVYCVVKDKYGNTVQTNKVTLRQAVSITTQPKTTTVAKNKTASVSVKASGDGLTYTWYIKNAGKTTYSKSSVTKSTYSVAMTSKVNGRLVYCVVKDKYGNTVKTTTVKLKMK